MDKLKNLFDFEMSSFSYSGIYLFLDRLGAAGEYGARLITHMAGEYRAGSITSGIRAI